MTADPEDRIPYRVALAGGWIDQPFVSRRNPDPPGSMVVVSLGPEPRFRERCGMATSTRRAAAALWGGRISDGDPAALMRELYAAENAGRPEPSGSQDMAGLLYPGVSRLDYDFAFEGGTFPRSVENTTDPVIARWLERVLHLVLVAPRPEGYGPLGVKNLDPEWIGRLGRSGRDCYDAIVRRDAGALGASLNECMRCWEVILPHTVAHPTITTDLKGILAEAQSRYAGAMYSGCGGGYLIVVSEAPVAGAVNLRVRLD